VTWRLDGRPLRRVLVTRLRYLGDVAMATVVPEVLRLGDPALEVDFLCEAAFAPILSGHDGIGRVHALGSGRRGDDARARRAAADRAMFGEDARGTVGAALALRRARYDLAVDLFYNPRSAWLLWLAGIPRRIGGTTSSSRRRLYTHIATVPPAADAPGLYGVAGGGLAAHLCRLAPLQHEDGRPFLQWLADTVAPGALRPRVVRPAPGGALLGRLAGLGAGPGRYTLLAPSATWPTKEWPAARWRDLVARLLDHGRVPVLLAPPGGAGDYAAAVDAVPDGRGGLIGPLSLRDALAAVGAARELVSVEGGVMHAGVAMGVPTVGLFGPTDPDLWFPYEDLGPYRVVATRPSCHPCHRHECDAFVCLPDLAAADVVTALEDAAAGAERS
jgi:ADP-heptose:LPS heptosyltransferase